MKTVRFLRLIKVAAKEPKDAGRMIIIFGALLMAVMLAFRSGS